MPEPKGDADTRHARFLRPEHVVANGDTAWLVERDWPDARLVLTMRHAAWPGLTLRRTYRLFDEGGQPGFYDDLAMELAEDIASGGVPSRAAAVDGFLDF